MSYTDERDPYASTWGDSVRHRAAAPASFDAGVQFALDHLDAELREVIALFGLTGPWDAALVRTIREGRAR